MRLVSFCGIFILSSVLISCGTSGYWYEISSSKRADASPELLQKLEVAKLVCNGEASKTVATSTKSSVTASVLADRVFAGCMAEQDLIVRP